MQIFDSNNTLISSFDVFDDAYIEKSQNKLDILSFSVPKSLGFKIKEEGYVEIPEGRFVVKEKKKSGKYYDIVCKPDTEVFEQEYIPNYTYTTQSFKSIMDQVLSGSGWSCVCTETGNKTLSGKQKTKWEIIQHAIELFKYEVRYDIKNKIIYAGKLLGNDRGAFFHHEVNLRELNVTSDTYDFCTKLIPIGKDDLTVEEINGGLNYVLPDVPVVGKTITRVWIDQRYTVKENLLADAKEKVNTFSKPYRAYEADVINLARLQPKKYAHLEYEVGDIITLVDKENNTYEKQRIVSKKEYLRDKLKDTVTIANRPKSISETSVQALSESIKVNKQYIDVLDGEIKAKVSTEEYNSVIGTMSQQIEANQNSIANMVTTIRNNADYLNDLNSAATAKDGQMLENLIEGFKIPHERFIQLVDQSPQDDATNTAKNDLITAYNDLISLYNNIKIDNVYTDAEWDSVITQLNVYKAKANDLESKVAQNTYKSISNLAERVSSAETKITDDKIINLVTQSETFKSALGTLKTDTTNELTTNQKGFNDTYSERMTDAEGNITEMKSFLDFDGPTSTMTIGKSTSEFKATFSNEMLAFLQSGDVIAYIKNSKLLIRDAVIQNSLITGNHQVSKYDDEITIVQWVGGTV